MIVFALSIDLQKVEREGSFVGDTSFALGFK